MRCHKIFINISRKNIASHKYFSQKYRIYRKMFTKYRKNIAKKSKKLLKIFKKSQNRYTVFKKIPLKSHKRYTVLKNLQKYHPRYTVFKKNSQIHWCDWCDATTHSDLRAVQTGNSGPEQKHTEIFERRLGLLSQGILNNLWAVGQYLILFQRGGTRRRFVLFAIKATV